MDLRIGATVVTREGHGVGYVREVLVDPATDEVAGIAVSPAEPQSRSFMVPLDLVEDSSPTLVSLRASARELERTPSTVEEFYGELEGGWQPAPGFGPGEDVQSATRPGGRHPSGEDLRIAANTEVLCSDGKVGTVDRLVVDDYTGEITSVIVAAGDYLTRDVEVPFAWVSSMEDGRLQLSCERQALRGMPSPEQQP